MGAAHCVRRVLGSAECACSLVDDSVITASKQPNSGWNKCVYPQKQNACTVIQARWTLYLAVGMPRPSGERDGLPDVLNARRKQDEALKAQAKAGVGDRAVAPQVQVPHVGLCGHAAVPQPLFQHLHMHATNMWSLSEACRPLSSMSPCVEALLSWHRSYLWPVTATY